MSKKRKEERSHWSKVLRQHCLTFEENVEKGGYNFSYVFDFIIYGKYSSIAIIIDGSSTIKLSDSWGKMLNRLGNHGISSVLSFPFSSLKYETEYVIDKIYTLLIKEEEKARTLYIENEYTNTHQKR